MKIKINQNTYKIFLVDSEDKRLEIEDGDFRSGMTDFRKKEIYISKDLSNDSFRYTTIHEITHAIIDSYGFLQVEWNDEIVADFMAIYVFEIERIIDEFNKQKNELLKKEGE